MEGSTEYVPLFRSLAETETGRSANGCEHGCRQLAGRRACRLMIEVR